MRKLIKTVIVMKWKVNAAAIDHNDDNSNNNNNNNNNGNSNNNSNDNTHNIWVVITNWKLWCKLECSLYIYRINSRILISS